MSNLAEKIPGVRASNRAYVMFLNKLRADSFDAMVATLSKNGGAPTAAEAEAIANFINVATGRGNMGSHAGAAETLATVFFSPRLMLSRFQVLAGQPMYRGTARTRRLIAQEYAKFLVGIGVVLGLGALAGASVEKDPRSSDFGKLRFGNTRLDPLSGLSQVTVLLSRLGSGETKNSSGKITPIRGEDVPYGSPTGADVIARFLRTKLSPVIGASVDMLSGKNVVGQPVSAFERKEGFPFVGGTIPSLLVPLGFRDIYDVMQEQGVAKGTAMTLLSLFGMGLQQYEGGKSAGKTAAGGSAREQMRRLAEPFRSKSASGGYEALRRALDQDDRPRAAAEILRLVREERRSPEKIGAALGIRADGTIKPLLFTGSAESERRMLTKLTPEQRKAWMQAQREHQQMARRFLSVRARLRGQTAAQ
jgi:hypothetical protein